MDMAAITHSMHGDAREYRGAVSRASQVTAPWAEPSHHGTAGTVSIASTGYIGVNRHASRLARAHLTELVMGHHVKIVCLSVGLLVALSGLFSVSFALALVKTTTVMAVTLQSAQSSVATGATFRGIAIGY